VPRILAAVLLAGLFAATAFGWGDDAHRAAVRGAVAVLPPEIAPFFQINSRFIAEHSIDPDSLPDPTAEQRSEHFLDLDAYDVAAAEIPRDRAEAERRFGRATVIERGLLPWAVQRQQQRLVAALKSGDWAEARLAAAHLSHYVADAHMPLHATANYDGQRTGNRGIHGRIEWELVPRYLGSPMIAAGKPTPIADPLEWAFAEVQDSLALVSPIMQADLACREETVLDSPEYYAALNRRIGPLLERRLRDAATAVARFYTSAWIEAGRPALPPKQALLILMDVPFENFSQLREAAETAARRHAAQIGPEDAVAVIAANAPKRSWQFEIEWGTAWDAREHPAVSFTGSVIYALQSALLALQQFPDRDRRLVILTNGLPEKMEVDEVIKELRKMGVKITEDRPDAVEAPAQ
jgi:hypothetical protein